MALDEIILVFLDITVGAQNVDYHKLNIFSDHKNFV